MEKTTEEEVKAGKTEKTTDEEEEEEVKAEKGRRRHQSRRKRRRRGRRKRRSTRSTCRREVGGCIVDWAMSIMVFRRDTGTGFTAIGWTSSLVAG